MTHIRPTRFGSLESKNTYSGRSGTTRDRNLRTDKTIARNRIPILDRSRGAADGAQRGRRSRGQSLVEFTLVLPMLLLLILVGLDFGRVFLGWVELNNVVREAANYAASNPNAWNSGTPDAAAQAAYQQLVTNDASGINCTMPSPVPTPAFPDGVNGSHPIGELVTASFTCQFRIITPVIGNIVGTNGLLAVSASAAFPVTNGAILGIPIGTAVPTPSPSASPSADPSASPTASPSAPSNCIVPNLVGEGPSPAQNDWTKAGFTTPVVFNPLEGTPPYKIGSQGTVPGTSELCSSTITVAK